MALAAALTSPAWRDALSDVLAGPEVQALEGFLQDERDAGHEVLPPPDTIFAALNAVAPDDVRVVLVGQDPYPTPGHAHGLAFSYVGGGTLPRSLRNIQVEIEDDVGVPADRAHGDLMPWAEQGVLLLNTVLTVRAGDAGSHRRKGWEVLTDAVLTVCSAQAEPLVFLLWGGEARKKKRLLAAHHHVLEAGHPSPLSIRHFRGCRHFSRTNELLPGTPIDWRMG